MLKEYKPAILFLLKYVVLYLVLNTAYAFYVNHYLPGPDPLTIFVTKNTAFFLSILDSSIYSSVIPMSAKVPLFKNNTVIVEVFEGCNGINVMIVFVAFLISFRGPIMATIKHIGLGIALIYMTNLLRVGGLFVIALHFPDKLYFVHKFLFTGIMYAAIFVYWYFWIAKVKRWNLQKAGVEG